MGTGMGIICERCDGQLDYADDYELKTDGYKHNLCGSCLADFKKQEWDKKVK